MIDILKNRTDKHLLRILPSGVVSKKDMGDLRILVSIVACNFEAALRHATESTTVAAITNTAFKINVNSSVDICPASYKYLQEPEHSVDAQVHVPDGGVHGGLGVGRPHRQPDAAADGESL